MTTFFLVIASLVLVGWFARHIVLTRTRRMDPFLHARPDADPPAGAPHVSVLIPARNEAANIGHALDAILTQNYPHLEVIVADDGSEDDTAQIVRDFAVRDPRVRLFQCRERSEGWTGKNHALWQISKETRGEVLLFLDADVTLDPGALAAMTSYFVENRLDMLSLLLRVRSTSLWEKAMHLLLGGMLMIRFPLRRVNRPDSRCAFANGQLIMMRAETYREVGGHEAVKSILLEDVALARVVKQKGHRLRVAYGFDVAQTRMYPSLSGIFQGWSRIFYSAFRGNPARLLLVLVLMVVFTLSPYVMLVYASVLLSTQGMTPSSFALLVLAAFDLVLMLTLMVRLNVMARGEPAYVALHFPAATLALFIVLMAVSRRFMPGGIVWKGIRYDVRRTPQQTS